MHEVLVALRLEQLPEGGFLATSDDLPGLVPQGRTVAETMEFAQDVARKLAESYREHGDTLPPALEATLDGSSAGFVSDRGAKGSHEIWWNPATRARATRPGDLPEGTVRAIVRQARLSVKEFLEL